MHKWIVFLLFFALLSLATLIFFYSCSKKKRALIALFPLSIIAAVFYWHWGAYPELTQHWTSLEHQARVQAILSDIHSPQELVARLKLRIEASPNNPKGWYLLGRLYASQSEWRNACESFAKAHDLNPKDSTITVNYGHALWQINHQQFDASIRALYQTVLAQNPKNADALAMLAMDAYLQHDTTQAIHYWESLLALVPANSEDAAAIRKAIAKAALGEPSPASRIRDKKATQAGLQNHRVSSAITSKNASP